MALLAATGSLDQQRFLCDEAIAHIEDCCPELAAYNVCGDSPACEPVITLPRSESECILELDCGEEATATCARIQEAQDNVLLDERVGPFRLGLGATASILGDVQATAGNYAAAVGIGPRAHAHWDFIEGDHWGGFLGLRGGVDFYTEGDAIVPHIALQIGVRSYWIRRPMRDSPPVEG